MRTLLKQHILRLNISMHNTLRMHIIKRTQYLPYNLLRISFRNTLLDNTIKKFPTLTQLQYQNITIFIIVDLVQTGYVGVIHVHHYGHFSEQILVFIRLKGFFVNAFCGTEDVPVFHYYLVHATEAAAADLANHIVIEQETFAFHFDEFIPFNFDFLIYYLLLPVPQITSRQLLPIIFSISLTFVLFLWPMPQKLAPIRPHRNRRLIKNIHFRWDVI